MSEISYISVMITMMHDDDEMIIHDRDRGHHVKCTEIMLDNAEIVLDEPRSASTSFQNSFMPTHHCPARSRAMVHHK